MAFALRNRREDGKFGFEVLSKIHYRCDVPATVAVVWCAPDRDDGLIFEMMLKFGKLGGKYPAVR